MPYDQYGHLVVNSFTPTSTPVKNYGPVKQAPIKNTPVAPPYQPVKIPPYQSPLAQSPWQQAANNANQSIATSGRTINPNEPTNTVKLNSYGIAMNYPQIPFTPQGFGSGVAVNTPGATGAMNPTVESMYAEALLNKPFASKGFGGAPGASTWGPAPGTPGHYLSIAEGFVPAGLGTDILPQAKATSGGAELGTGGASQGYMPAQYGAPSNKSKIATFTPAINPMTPTPEQQFAHNYDQAAPEPSDNLTNSSGDISTPNTNTPTIISTYTKPSGSHGQEPVAKTWAAAAQETGNRGINPFTGKAETLALVQPGVNIPSPARTVWPFEARRQTPQAVRRKRNPLLDDATRSSLGG